VHIGKGIGKGAAREGGKEGVFRKKVKEQVSKGLKRSLDALDFNGIAQREKSNESGNGIPKKKKGRELRERQKE